jgi:hypothetical protein
MHAANTKYTALYDGGCYICLASVRSFQSVQCTLCWQLYCVANDMSENHSIPGILKLLVAMLPKARGGKAPHGGARA